MHETHKAMVRRYRDGKFLGKYFAGKGLDIIPGGGEPIGMYQSFFPRIAHLDSWTYESGDAMLLGTLTDNQYDFIHSGQVIEHTADPYIAMENWIRVCKPGGYLIITVPDEELYEKLQWPSTFNPDHKWSFSLGNKKKRLPHSVNLCEMVLAFSHQTSCLKMELIDDFYIAEKSNEDQTLLYAPECSIELILRKK